MYVLLVSVLLFRPDKRFSNPMHLYVSYFHYYMVVEFNVTLL